MTTNNTPNPDVHLDLNNIWQEGPRRNIPATSATLDQQQTASALNYADADLAGYFQEHPDVATDRSALLKLATHAYEMGIREDSKVSLAESVKVLQLLGVTAEQLDPNRDGIITKAEAGHGLQIAQSQPQAASGKPPTQR